MSRRRVPRTTRSPGTTPSSSAARCARIRSTARCSRLSPTSSSAAAADGSIIHTPPEHLPEVFAELRRVLAPGGHVLVAVHVGDERRRVQRPYGHDVPLHAYRLPVERVAGLLADAGIAVHARL